MSVRVECGYLMMVGDNDGWLGRADIGIRKILLYYFHAHRYRYEAPSSANTTHRYIFSKTPPLFFIPTRLRPLNFFAVLLLKSPHWNLIQSQQRLIRILHQDVLAILHAPAHVHDRPNDAPSISEVEIHLLGEFPRVITDDAEDDMSVRDLRRSSGYETVI